MFIGLTFTEVTGYNIYFVNIKREDYSYFSQFTWIVYISCPEYPPGGITCFKIELSVQKVQCPWRPRAPSSLSQSHASATTGAWPYQVRQSVFLSMWSSWGVSEIQTSWMFQIYKYVIKGHEELTSCLAVMHSYLFPLLDVLYRKLSWESKFRHGANNHIVAAIQGAGNTMTSAWDSELIYLSDLSY